MSDLDVFNVLDAASATQEQLGKQLDIDKMTDIQDRIMDQKADMEERADFFIQAGKTEDDEELLDELNEMEANALAAEMEDVEIGAGHIQAKNPVVNSGPMYVGAAKGKSEEDELNELQAMMS
jgi:hypothetical protein